MFDLSVNDRNYQSTLLSSQRFFLLVEVNSRDFTHELDGGRSHMIRIPKMNIDDSRLATRRIL